MIEKFFLTGVRVLWPEGARDAAAGMDGSIVQNPPLGAKPMTFDGMDGELYNLAQPNITSLGLTKGKAIPFSWLCYAPGHTTKKMLSAGDVLTGYMSGCPIALWSENGIRYVGHVGTIDSSPAVNELVRRTFADFMPPDVTGFNPAAAWQPNEIAAMLAKIKTAFADPKILALVTTAGEFYSIVSFRLTKKAPHDYTANTFLIGGAKRVTPLDYQGMRRYLLPNAPLIGAHG